MKGKTIVTLKASQPQHGIELQDEGTKGTVVQSCFGSSDCMNSCRLASNSGSSVFGSWMISTSSSFHSNLAIRSLSITLYLAAWRMRLQPTDREVLSASLNVQVASWDKIAGEDERHPPERHG